MGAQGKAVFSTMDMYRSDETPGEGYGKPRNGCFVKITTGFILLFLAMILAVGVGLIVHFVENRDIHCDVRSTSQTTGADPVAANLAGNCKNLASKGDNNICSSCPTPTKKPQIAISTTNTVRGSTSSDLLTTSGIITNSKNDDVRLPKTLAPIQYDLELQPNLYGTDSNSFSFDGVIRIKFSCLETTNEITVHTNMLTIDVQSIIVEAEDGQGSIPKFESLAEDEVKQFSIFKLDGNLMAGNNYSIHMKFTGPLKPDLRGLYLSSYQEAGVTKYLATTQFQPTDARKSFPCFDEPELKAVFNITLIRHRDWTSLSNMGVLSSENRDNDMVADHYDVTPRMSTYLVAFVVSQFSHTTNRTRDSIQERAWARPESSKETEIALNAGLSILPYYEDLFGIKFPLEKQDMIAIPDYPLGAMENWGLVTYRETALLYQPGISTESNKQRIVTVVAHEFSHQWFGNLVTMKWWDDIWLNEGFATFMEYVGTNHVHPEWNIFDEFTISETFDAFAIDGLKSSHPVYVPVNNPDEIGEIFDRISYAKGGSLVRMMKWFLGEQIFNDGLSDYLKKLSYQNAFHDDLWNSLQERSEKEGKALPMTVKEIMDTWIKQMNYPVVMVTKTNNGLHLTQTRFLINKNSTDEEKYPPCCNYIWKIPFSYTSNENMDFNTTENDVVWMDSQTKDITDSTLTGSSNWILGNVQQYGYYRVNYDNENWQLLIQQLKTNHERISVLNRAQIINDVWNLAKAGETDMNNALQSVEYLDKERSHVPWISAVRELGYMDEMLSETILYDNFKKFMKSKVEQLYNSLSDDPDESHLTILLKSQLTRQACAYGVTRCIDQAQSLYRSWMENPQNSIDPNIKSTVYCTAISAGTQDEWNFAYNQYKQTQVASEKAILISVLGCSKEIGILNHYLQLTLDPSEVRGQDIGSVINSVAANVIGRSLAWRFVVENWTFLRQTLGGGFSRFSSLIKGVTASFNEDYDLQQLKQFVADHPDLGTGERAFSQAIENTESNIKFMKDNMDIIKSWLEKVINPSETTTDVRLPRTVLPEHYDLELKADMYGDDPEKFMFYGYINIHLHCFKDTSNITLHQRDIEIDKGTIKLQNPDGSSASQNSVHLTFDLEREFVIFQLQGNLQAGNSYQLSFNFSGPLKEDLHGFYLSSYTRGDNVVYMAVSDFEPNDARKAFPCFDEPDIKATYNITVLRKPGKISLSNMPKIREEPRSDRYVADIYEKTKKISTYLVAFIVSDFAQNTMTTRNNKIDSIWARPEYINQTSVALTSSAEIISYYEDYFDIPYPLPKQDLIAIPDFSAGAMENWGLITYKEIYLLYEEGTSSADDKQRVVTVIAHELGHQWFGDLVTMEWWDDLWLNEGFATFIEYIGTERVFPDWKMFEQFPVNEIHRAFGFDGLVTSHPIYVPVKSPAEIGQIFDAISYAKGASVIRMMRHILGEQTFKKGLHNYLLSREYGNAFHDDLWFALGNQSKAEGRNIDVKAIMDTWILQMNYPVVKVTQSGDGNIHVSQKRFLVNPNATDPGKYHSEFGYKWKIPFTFTTSGEKNFSETNKIIWLETDNKDISTNLTSKADWIIGNVQQFGYYRVNYDTDNWQSLIKQLNTDHKAINVINRAQIIDDAWALSSSEAIDIDIALNTLQYLKDEDEYTPWATANKEIIYVDNMLSRTALYGKFQDFMKNLIKTPYSRINTGAENSSHLQLLTKSKVFSIACRFSDAKCVDESKSQYQNWMDQPETNKIDPNIKGTLYCTAIREGGEEEWNFAYNQYKTSDTADEKNRLLNAMGCTRETWILSKYLDLALDTTEISLQNFVTVVTSVSQNPVGRDLAWNYVRANWDTFGKILGYRNGEFIYARSLMAGIFDSFNTEYDLMQMTEFHDQHSDLGSATQNFNQAVEKTEQNIKWMTKNYQTIEKWLTEAASGSSSQDIKDVRLPTSVIPSFYTVEIFPDFYGSDPDQFSFNGSVRIHVQCMSTTNNITLHGHKLEVDQQSITIGADEGNGPAPKFLRMSQDLERQFFIFYLDSELVAGNKYFIEMNFKGPLKNDLTGLYLSSYKRGSDTVYMATTQFEPTDARKAFPCFDEPEIKAKFNISIVRKSDLVALSNMPIIKTMQRTDNFEVDVFQPSEKMSTYLVAMIVCDFKHTTGRTKTNITYGAWARPESVNQTKLALGIAVDVLSYYEEYFMVDFPLPKQDMIAIPDFAAGAMENWGLITYRETAMLFEPGVSSESNKQRVATVIAHELAHQWFGDLVTMDWWDDIWLNEGFATYVEYIGTNHAFPDWKMTDRFTEEIHSSMAFDGLVTSHPIYVPVANPDEINEIFDSISYAKGSSVIRMMVHFLGEPTFRKGISNYLQNRKYRNAFHDDLWMAMTNQSKADGHETNVKKVMDTWTLQMNYPVIKVTKMVNGDLRLEQKRFLRNPTAKDPLIYTSPYGYQWIIPFTYTTKTELNFDPSFSDIKWMNDTTLVAVATANDMKPIPEHLISPPNTGVHVSFDVIPANVNNSDWVIGNPQLYGYYRVNYEEANWLDIINQIKSNNKIINLINRAQIINDAWALANAGEIDMNIALKTVEYLGDEEEYIPWSAADDELSYVKHMLERTELYGRFSSFMKKLVDKPFKNFGFNNTGADHMQIYMRSLLVALACSYGVQECTDEAVRQFQEWMNNPDNNPIDPNMKGTVYCTAISEGGWEEWNFAYNQYKTATVVAEQSRILSALSCTRQTWILTKYLGLVLDENEVRTQDAINVILYISSNTIGRDLVWNFVRSNWNTLMRDYGGGSFSFAKLFGGIFKTFNTPFDLQQMRDFQAKNPDMGSGTRAFAQAVEKTEANIQWMTKNYDIINKWLPNTNT